MAIFQTTPKYNIRVLHIDDDPSILEISKQILMMEDDLKVTSVTSVEEALIELSKEKFDTVVVDYEMPLKNGLQFLEELRKDQNEIPFILFTGKGREEVVITALNLGANGYVNKQGDPQTVYGELIHSIRTSVYKYKAEESLRESEEKYSAIIEQATDGIFIIREQTLEYANPALAKMLKYTASEIENQPFLNFFPPESQEEIIQKARERFAGKILEKPYEIKMLCKDGTIIDVEITGKLIQYRGKPANIGVIRNITERKKVQEALRQNEAQYHDLINGMVDTVWVIDFDGGFLDVNYAACKVLGYSRDELLSVGIAGIDKNLSRDQVRGLIDRLPKVGFNFFETIHKTKDGRDIPVEITSTLISYQGKQAILSIARDITERKKAEEIIREAERRWITTLSSIGDAVIATDIEGKITFMNRIAEQLMGWSHHDAFGLPLEQVFRIINEKTREPVENPIVRILKEGKIIGLANHTVLINKNGNEIPIDDSGAPIRDENNELLGAVLVFRDVTERKESEARYRSLFNNMLNNCIYGKVLFDTCGKATDLLILEVNEVFKRTTGFENENLIGKKTSEIIPGIREDYPQIFDLIGKVALTGTEERLELFFDPIKIWIQAQVYCPRKGYIVGLFENITERKNAEAQLRASEENYRNLFDNAEDVIATHDFAGKIISINKVVEKYGFQRDSIIGRNLVELIPQKYWARLSDQIRELAQGRSISGEAEVVTSNGAIFVDYKSVPLRQDGQITNILTILRDIDEQKRSERDLLESEEKYRILFDQAGDYILVLEVPSVGVPLIFDANQYALDVHGYSRDELVGKPITFLDSSSTEVEILNRVKRLLKNEKLAFEATHKRKDGSQFFVEVINKHIKIRDRNFLLSIERDVTERKKIEDGLNESRQKLELLNSKLKNACSLTRHDIQNKLTSLNGYIYLLKKDIQDNSSALNILKEIENTSQQIIKIIEFERVYEQIGIETLDFLEVKKLFLAAVSLISDFGNVKLRVDIDGLMVFADSLLRQVLYNFVDNSLKYGMPLDEIRLWYKEESNALSLIYEDNGLGISEEMHNYLFERGFGRGSGFGLFMTKKIVEGYGWTIEEKGAKGKGARFVIKIPKTNKKGQVNYKFEDQRPN